MNKIHDQIEASLNQLRGLISEAVRNEQRTDQLTGLPNDAALTEILQNSVDKELSFWIAFVEIDYFKRINDKWGYENADCLLITVAKRLSNYRDHFEEEVFAYRAHGDEFFLVGLEPEKHDHIDDRLNHVRTDISKIRVPPLIDKQLDSMQCTISIGWITSEEARKGQHDLSPRNVKFLLEHAVTYAKTKGRNVVVKYDSEMKKSALDERRDNCSQCRTSFTAAIPIQSSKNSALHCPNCGIQCETNASALPVEMATTPNATVAGQA